MEFLKHPERTKRHILSMPFIYGMIVPLVFFDLCLEIYHRVCFPLYGMSYVTRSSYIRIDRHRLSYLAWWQKLHCLYCGYANGVLRYGVAIAAKTEAYWCGIQQKSDSKFRLPSHQKKFLPYNNEAALNQFLHDTPQDCSKK